MPTTWWQYWLYGLMELTPPSWFWWWSILLVVAVWVLIWIVFFDGLQGEEPPWIQEVVIRKWVEEFGAVDSLEGMTKLLLEWSGEYDPEIPLWITLIALSHRPLRSKHRTFLKSIEQTLYDPQFEAPMNVESVKQYLIDDSYFDGLTKVVN